MKPVKFIDPDTMDRAQASVQGQTMPTLKSATAATLAKVLVPLVLAALPTIAGFVPAIAPFIGAINAMAKLFGYGA